MHKNNNPTDCSCGQLSPPHSKAFGTGLNEIAMKKTILYKLFGLGAVPKKLLPVLDLEEIVVADQGMSGRFITKNVKGPGKRYINRSEGFSGCLVITKKRVVCFTYGKRQINISVDDPRISELFVNIPKENLLSISFESSVFREGWSGEISFRFKTERAQQFHHALKSSGVRHGTAPQPQKGAAK